MRVVIYGSRIWNDQAAMTAILDRLHGEHGFTEVLHGGCLHGTDWHTDIWASRNKLPIRRFCANQRYGKTAEPFRNSRIMLVGKPELGVQFPGGGNTRDMRRQLEASSVRVIDAVSPGREPS